MQNWEYRFIEQQVLPRDYVVATKAVANAVLTDAQALTAERDKPLLLGINGCQGSGKTTFTALLCAILKHEHQIDAIALSIDDFYLTRQQRLELAEKVHPLLATRGVPGTHDTRLLNQVLDGLIALYRGYGQAVAIPRFDKLRDDRQAVGETLAQPVAVVFLEGWCVGALPQEPRQLLEPVNSLEREQDPTGAWREYVNLQLATTYRELFDRLDHLTMLRAPGFEHVLQWRCEQEQKLADGAGAGVEDGSLEIMSQEEIREFTRFFQRITSDCIERLPAHCNMLIELDKDRNMQISKPGDTGLQE